MSSATAGEPSVSQSQPQTYGSAASSTSVESAITDAEPASVGVSPGYASEELPPPAAPALTLPVSLQLVDRRLYARLVLKGELLRVRTDVVQGQVRVEVCVRVAGADHDGRVVAKVTVGDVEGEDCKGLKLALGLGSGIGSGLELGVRG